MMSAVAAASPAYPFDELVRRAETVFAGELTASTSPIAFKVTTTMRGKAPAPAKFDFDLKLQGELPKGVTKYVVARRRSLGQADRDRHPRPGHRRAGELPRLDRVPGRQRRAAGRDARGQDDNAGEARRRREDPLALAVQAEGLIRCRRRARVGANYARTRSTFVPRLRRARFERPRTAVDGDALMDGAITSHSPRAFAVHRAWTGRSPSHVVFDGIRPSACPHHQQL
jgi:hypothetical protein